MELFQTNPLFKKPVTKFNPEDALQTEKTGLTFTENKRLSPYEKLPDFILKRLQTNKMNYVFIDEIQLPENWERGANTLRLRDNVDVYLTG